MYYYKYYYYYFLYYYYWYVRKRSKRKFLCNLFFYKTAYHTKHNLNPCFFAEFKCALFLELSLFVFSAYQLACEQGTVFR